MKDPKRDRFLLEQREREIQAIGALARTVVSSPSLGKVVIGTYRQIYWAAESDLVVLFFREGDKLIFQKAAEAAHAGEGAAAVEKSLGDCLCGMAAETGKMVYSSDIKSDPRCTLDECKRTGVRSFAALPLVVAEEILGVLGIGSLKKRDFSKQSVFLEILASQVAIAVKNASLSRHVQEREVRLAEEMIRLQEAQENLRHTEAGFRAVFESSRDGIFLKDRNLVYTHVNAAMERLLGMAADRICGQTEGALFGPETGEDVRELDRRVLNGEVVEAEHARAVGDTELFFRDLRVPLKDSGGRIVGLCGTARDVTERRSALDASGAWTPEYQSKAMKTALNEARLAAATGSTILLTGESGAGKDRFARFIHDHSGRSDRPFHAINCAAIPLDLAESELFGHEAGAFTGARGRKKGIFEIADGGTLLLNEIGDLPPSIQGKLLAFLDTKTLTRVGGERSLTVDVRLIAATNRDLQKEVGEGRFRRDLFYRLNVFSVKVPPLRERIEDLPALVHEITCELASEMCLSNWPLLSFQTLAMMKRHSWPGNVRELRNLLARTLVLCANDESMEVESLGPQPYQQEETAPGLSLPEDKSMRDLFAEMERSFIEEALRRSGGKKEAAAELLGISRHALKRRLKKYPELVVKPRTR